MRQIVLPELAESIVEGEILKWLVAEGELVAAEQPICEVMTDKVTAELPSPVAGRLVRQLVKEGDVVAVHAPIALLEESGAMPETAPPADAPAPGAVVFAHQQAPQGAPVPPPPIPDSATPDPGEAASLFKVMADEGQALRVSGLRRERASVALAPEPAQVTAPAPTAAVPEAPMAAGRVLAVPAARALARQLGVDLGAVAGSGPNGRIRPQDVQSHSQEAATGQPRGPVPPPLPEVLGGGEESAAPAPAARPAEARMPGSGLNVPPPVYRSTPEDAARETRTPLRGLRRAISSAMQASHLYTVRTLTVDEANLSELVALRARLKPQTEAQGVKLSYLPFIFRAVTAALRKFPSLNTSFDEATQEIVSKDYVHLGMAVATEAGLVVPVIRDAGHKSLLALAAEVSDLAARAAAGKLKAPELSGSSFSLTNIGSVGALFTFPIINVPDAAILGVHSITRRPVVAPDGSVVAAHMMYLSLSFDHRLVDGAEAARFCKEVIRLLETPELLLLEG